MPPTTANPRNANLVLMEAVAFNRSDFVLRGKRLEYFTIGYNTVEGLISLVAGFVAGSISLVGFGLDSLIEVISGAGVLGLFIYESWVLKPFLAARPLGQSKCRSGPNKTAEISRFLPVARDPIGQPNDRVQKPVFQSLHA